MSPRNENERTMFYLRHPRLARQPNRTQVQNQVNLFPRGRLKVAFEVMPMRWWTFLRKADRESRPVWQVLTLTEIQNLGLKTRGPGAVIPA